MGVLKTAIVSLVVGIVLAAAALILLSAPGSAVGMKAFEVEAPVEESFAFMADAKNWAGCIPLEISEVQGEGLGQTFSISYEFGFSKQTLKQDMVWAEFEPNKWLVAKAGNTFTNDGAYYFTFSPADGGGTRIVWIGEGTAYVPAVFAVTPWGRDWGMKDYLKYMDGFAKCVKEKIEKK